ncbi:MAG: Gfo/Idh/MocA family oxidoreductase [bacterium]
MEELKLGIIGLSDGNGHPYSWSAIFNGYNQEHIQDCPFPVIPDYLSKQKFPDDCIKNVRVTHIWTQDKTISENVAKSANIPNIVDDIGDLISLVDGILLARDDAENHYEMSLPFLKAGIPIYIDKPLALDFNEAKKIYNLEQYDGQIFTCSAISYAKELMLTDQDYAQLGKIKYINAYISKDWSKYAIHIIEPVLKLMGNQGDIIDIKKKYLNDKVVVTVVWQSGLKTRFFTLGNVSTPIKIKVCGLNHTKKLIFKDTFSAFKSALQHFVNVIRKTENPPDKNLILKSIKILELGKN